MTTPIVDKAKPFADSEVREISLAATDASPAGTMLAAFLGRFAYATHEARHFRLDILGESGVSPVRVQLNSGDPADDVFDENRLKHIAESLLEPLPDAVSSTLTPTP